MFDIQGCIGYTEKYFSFTQEIERDFGQTGGLWMPTEIDFVLV